VKKETDGAVGGQQVVKKRKGGVSGLEIFGEKRRKLFRLFLVAANRGGDS
jgi:hypothetical protein